MRAALVIFKYLAFGVQFVLAYGCLSLPESSSPSSALPAPKKSSYRPGAPLVYQADYYASQYLDFELDLNSIDANLANAQNLVLENAPGWLGLNASTLKLEGTPQEGGLFANLKVRGEVGGGPYVSQSFSIAVNGDPLHQHAWHLKNTGQKSFALFSGVVGADINVHPVYASGITGKNVRVAVSDSGVEIYHDDLHENALSSQHRDFSLRSPYIGEPYAKDFHGTAVASIISAKGWNNEGGIGVAPDSRFAGFQFLDSDFSTAVLIAQASGDFDVFNYSYGDLILSDTLSDLDYIDHLRERYRNGRNGKGAVFVKSAGNEFYLKSASSCVSHNANFPLENESPFVIVVGAINAQGLRSSYSSAGSNLWVSAPGGEYGDADPAIIAADLPSCSLGRSRATSNPINDLDLSHPLDPQCRYTASMNGTSAAAPMVSGVIALMLEANPNLSAREIKHILALTSKKVDALEQAQPRNLHPSKSPALSGCSDLSLSGHDYDLGWVKNAADFEFNNYYGFGMVDAHAAVIEAQNPGASWYPFTELIELNPYFSQANLRSSPNLDIPDADALGVEDSITVTGTAPRFFIESVQIKLRADHRFSGELGAELISPSGTRSRILNVNNSFLLQGDSNLNIVLSSHAFYGESANGEWKIKLYDGLEDYTGKLARWDLNILGHDPDA